MSHKQRTIIAFEGVDGAGKSTLVTMLAKRIRGLGKKVGVVSASMSPADRSLVSEVDTHLRSITRSTSHTLDPYCEICIYLARLREKRNAALKLIEEETCDIVIIDRYVYSNRETVSPVFFYYRSILCYTHTLLKSPISIV